MWGGLLPRVGLRFQEKIKSFIRPSKLLKTFKSNKYYRKSFVYKVLVNFQYCSFSSPLNSEESEVQSRTRVLRLAETLHCSLLQLVCDWSRPRSAFPIVLKRRRSLERAEPGVQSSDLETLRGRLSNYSEACSEIVWNRALHLIGNSRSIYFVIRFVKNSQKLGLFSLPWSAI